jgi:hypothetical protein
LDVAANVRSGPARALIELLGSGTACALPLPTTCRCLPSETRGSSCSLASGIAKACAGDDRPSSLPRFYRVPTCDLLPLIVTPRRTSVDNSNCNKDFDAQRPIKMNVTRTHLKAAAVFRIGGTGQGALGPAQNGQLWENSARNQQQRNEQSGHKEEERHRRRDE